MLPIIRPTVVLALSMAVLHDPLAAQSSIRGWLGAGFDTEGRVGHFVQVAAGTNSTIVRRSDGRLFANGELAALTHPPVPPPGRAFIDADIGDHVAVGLLDDGTAMTWLWSAVQNTAAYQPPALPVGVTFLDVATGTDHVLAVRSDGLIEIWGELLGFPQIGSVPALPPGVGYTQVQSSPGHAVALRSDGAAVAWGRNTSGQCNVPALPAGMSYWQVDAGFHHTVALRSDGNILAWGDNADGQCTVPALPPGTHYTAVAAGASHSLALRSDGVVLAWGWNYSGQATVPTFPPGTGVVALAGGNYHSVALLSNGKVQCWGYQGAFQGNLPELDPNERWTRISCGIGNHVHGLTSRGTIHTWGNWDPSYPPPPLPPGVVYTDVAAGWTHNIALRSDGEAVAWGLSNSGAMNIPPLLPGLRYEQVAVSSAHTVLLRSDGEALAFGYNAFYQCNVPPLPPGTRYVKVAASNLRTLLLRSDGQVIVVGDGANGLHGLVPGVPPGVEYVDIASGFGVSLARRSDGELAVWPVPGPSSWNLLPPVPAGVAYVEVAASGSTGQFVVRRSDGQVVHAGVHPLERTVPPLLPGTSYVEVAANSNVVVARVGEQSTYVSFATGCAGSRPASRLVPQDTPRIGQELIVRAFDLPQDAMFLVFGWQQTAPLSLAPYGAPGCALHVSVDGAYFFAGHNGVAKYRFVIPNVPGLVGTRFYHQALVLDPQAGNTLGAVVSAAAEAVVGHW